MKNWTRLRPTTSGWYWWKYGVCLMPVCLTKGGDWLAVQPFDQTVGHWSERITPPPEDAK